jgi:hypothetical protein
LAGAKSAWPPSDEQERFAQAGAGRQHGDRRFVHRRACVDLGGFLGQQMRDGVGDGLQIVEQADALEAEAFCQRAFLDDPGQVGQMRPPGDHRAGHIEAGGRRVAFRVGEERLHDRFQTLVIGAVEFLLGDEFAWPGFRRDQRQACLGAADIARDQHQFRGSFHIVSICSSDCPLVSGTVK